MASEPDAHDDGDMNSTHPAPSPTIEDRLQASGPRWLAAFAAGIAIQVAAAMTALLAVAIFLIAAFEDWGDQTNEGMPAYVLLSIPIGAAAPGLFVVSGAVTSRIIGDSRGWWVLLFGPLTWGLMIALAGAF